MYVGVDYYPEHWPRSRWKTDAALMKKAGFNIVRLAEFAWKRLEPSEGVFDFEWLDEALGTLGDNGISAILGTPTAAMPAWVARKYPETLSMQTNGVRTKWGIRKNNCFTSGAFRLLSERITSAMATHFAKTANVIGWQTDNEFSGAAAPCHCESCAVDFQEWLKDRYGDINALNTAWGTHFWGHLYGSWAEIQFPTENWGHNPSACLDWRRWCSWVNVRFQRDQVRILRRSCPRHFVTHNLMGLHKEVDYYDFAQDLDFVSWDNYPVWEKPSVPYTAAFAADVMRGVKKQNFWVMEQTAGSPGWGTMGRNPRPGEIRSVGYQQVGRGADNQVWFRWRTCTAGREQYWHGLLGHDGVAGRRYREAARVASEYHALAPELAGTTVKTPVAIIYDYDSLWAVMIQAGIEGNDYQECIGRYYRAFFRAGVNVDMVRPGSDISGYKVVLAPSLFVLPDAVADQLVSFVKEGGVLLTDTRSGVKTETGLCWDRTLPGRLAPALGITIQEYDALTSKQEFALVATSAFEGAFTAHMFADWVELKGAKALVHHSAWYMKDYAALTRNEYGTGKGWYVGTVVKEDAFYDQLALRLMADAGLKPLLKPPAGVEVTVREGKGKKLVFIVNHTEEPQTVDVPVGKVDLLTGKKTQQSLVLERFGVAVLKYR